MPVTPNQLLVLNMFADDFQEDLLCLSPRGQGDTGWSVVPWILFLGLLEDRQDSCFLPRPLISMTFQE